MRIKAKQRWTFKARRMKDRLEIHRTSQRETSQAVDMLLDCAMSNLFSVRVVAVLGIVIPKQFWNFLKQIYIDNEANQSQVDKLICLAGVLLAICHLFSPLSECRKIVKCLPLKLQRLVRTHLNDCWLVLTLSHAIAAVLLLPSIYSSLAIDGNDHLELLFDMMLTASLIPVNIFIQYLAVIVSEMSFLPSSSS